MDIETFLLALKQNPEANNFSRTMAVIDSNYNFTPTAFQNGDIENKAGENNGSCKIFSFASLHRLNEASTLACFGEYYFQDVLKDPGGTGHQNIRNFMKWGWKGVSFKGTALVAK